MKKIRMIGVIVIVSIVFLIFGLKLHMSNEVISENQISYEQTIPSIAHGYRMKQCFVPQYEKIEEICIYVDALSCAREQGYLSILLLDESQDVYYEKEIPFSDLPDYGWVEVVSDIDVEKQECYSLVLESMEAVDDGPKISFYASEIAASVEEINQPFSYADIEMEDCDLRMRFVYQVEIRKDEYLILYLFVVFLACVITSKIQNIKK